MFSPNVSDCGWNESFACLFDITMNCNSLEFRAFFNSGDVICIWIDKFVFQAVKWEYSHITRSVVKEGVTKRVMPVSLMIRVWFEYNPNVSRVQYWYDLYLPSLNAKWKKKLCVLLVILECSEFARGLKIWFCAFFKSLIKLLLFSRILMMAFFIGPLASSLAYHLVSVDYVGDQAWTNMCAWFSWDYNLKVLPWKSQAPGGRWVEMTLWINSLWSLSIWKERERWAFNSVHRTRGRRLEPMVSGQMSVSQRFHWSRTSFALSFFGSGEIDTNSLSHLRRFPLYNILLSNIF